MKVIIPAKAQSARVPNKNWKFFYKDLSLVDIKIQQLLAVGVSPADIFVSCEDPEQREIVTENYNANFLLREPRLASDNTHWSDVVTAIVQMLPARDDEPIAWVQVTCPLFDEFGNMFSLWNKIYSSSSYDSMVAVKPFKKYLLDGHGRPVNFQFGRWHAVSQELPVWYTMDVPIHIFSKSTALRCNYYVGARPYLYVIHGPSVDIDTPEEYKLAQWYYQRKLDAQLAEDAEDD